MKKRLKVILLSSLAICLISTVTWAAANLENIQAVINHGIKVTVDGKQVSLKDEAGVTYDPIVYNGRTYVPARFVANALGATVNWDQNTSTVVINSGVNSGVPYKDVNNQLPISSQPTSNSPVVTQPSTKPSSSEGLWGGIVYGDPQMPGSLTGKIGNYSLTETGKRFIIDNFKAFTKIGFDVEESLASDDSDYQMVKLQISLGDFSKEEELYKTLSTAISQDAQKEGWSLIKSEDPYNDGFNTYLLKKNGVYMEVNSGIAAIVITIAKEAFYFE